MVGIKDQFFLFKKDFNNGPARPFFSTPLADLHLHVGSAVDPAVMWTIAQDQGIRLPTKNYWEFVEMITIPKSKKLIWDKYHQLFKWTELIQSSPEAIEESVYQIISGAYRKCNIRLIEVGFCPMLRNRQGERDLDHIILAATRGMNRAQLHFPTQAGLIFMLDKRLSFSLNKILVEKAIKYRSQGVIAIDFAGPKKNGFKYHEYTKLYQKAKNAGLGLIVHAGEEGTAKQMLEAISALSPDRVVHGIKAAFNQSLTKKIKRRNINLAICPTSNLKTGVVKNLKELKKIVQFFWQEEVPFTINTDGPEMLQTNILNEYALLLKNKILTESQIKKVIQSSFELSFVKEKNDY